ncbi:MAG: hypothetical protein GPOALKHO_001634 [Sodalis sp.]|nr:MAG: hypothetical protein GPOALKHO_001634 [Sodalis sp.]
MYSGDDIPQIVRTVSIFTNGVCGEVCMGIDLNRARIADVDPDGVRIVPDMLAVEALNLMQVHHIASLLAAGSAERPLDRVVYCMNRPHR